MTAVDHDDELPAPEIAEKPEIAALLETVARLKADNAAKAELIAELQCKDYDADLRPLKRLCRTDREYENALWASRRPAKVPKVVKMGGKVLSKPSWVDHWRRITGRLGA